MKVFFRFLSVVLLAICGIYLLLMHNVRKSKDCERFVIDSYEVASGINIPKQNGSECYYFEDLNTRISIFQIPNTTNFINRYQFKSGDFKGEIELWSEVGNAKALLSSFSIQDSIHKFCGEHSNSQWQCFLNQKTGKLLFEIKWI
jgi:hypothetical protein